MGCQCSKFDRTHEAVTDFMHWYSDVIQSQAKEHNVLVYSRVACSNSTKAKELLRTRKIKFEYFELEHMNERDQFLNVLQTISGRKNTPFVFVNGQYIGDHRELASAIKKNVI